MFLVELSGDEITLLLHAIHDQPREKFTPEKATACSQLYQKLYKAKYHPANCPTQPAGEINERILKNLREESS